MSSGTVKRRWTARDEATFNELQQRKASIMEENSAPLIILAQDAPGCPPQKEFVDWLIANADRVRDALEPFDSGARPSEQAA